MLSRRVKKVVVIGGGTGSFTLLRSLKEFPINITALVNMADDGGSSGILRDELGVLPPGDVRQCLVALSESPVLLRELFSYRFPKSSTLAGHSFGNLFLSALEMMSRDFGEAVRLASEILNIKGTVVPITLDNCNLVLESRGGVVRGEYAISKMAFESGERPRLSLSPKADLNPKARQALEGADLVVIAPGDLYGSLVPALLVEGVADVLQRARNKVIYVCNLVNKPHQTADFAVHDYVEVLGRFIGEGTIDYVLYNTNEPSEEMLTTYALANEFPVKIDKEALKKASYKAVGGHFLFRSPQRRNKNDIRIRRSLIRHDGEAVARALMRII